MKAISILTLFLPALLILSLGSCCEDDDMPVPTPEINCEVLEDALIYGDEAIIETEVNEMCSAYPPASTTDDEIGHKVNLNTIIFELNTQCSGFVAALGCYACLESFPPQSVIDFTLDSAGVSVERCINLLTPEDEVMTYTASCD